MFFVVFNMLKPTDGEQSILKISVPMLQTPRVLVPHLLAYGDLNVACSRSSHAHTPRCNQEYRCHNRKQPSRFFSRCCFLALVSASLS